MSLQMYIDNQTEALNKIARRRQRSSSLPQGIQQWDYSSKVAGRATCTVSQTKFISTDNSCTAPIGSSLLSNSTTHLKNGQVSTKRGPDVMWTSFRLRVCAAE